LRVAIDRDQIKQKMTAIAAQGAFIGTSSWGYEGWLGQLNAPAQRE
jgi:hypothetical protein